MKITFYKYQGTGNDFIIIDNRKGDIRLSTKQINFLCNRKFGIGADGLMLLNLKKGFDFKMVYYNADGNESSMCGNGGRCLTQFAFDRGIKKQKYLFIAIDGKHESEFDGKGWINLKMLDVKEIKKHQGNYILNTGSPHYVKSVLEVNEYNVFKEGQKIRYSKQFAAKGINVNFVQQPEENKLIVRTYERGVENETLSCGTGVTASALIFSNDNAHQRINIETLGGKLAVEFDKISDHSFKNIWLCGPATFVFKGEINLK